MIEFRRLSDDDPVLAYSPLLRAARLTLEYVEDNGAISLTNTKAFKRVFVHWAAEHFDWPGRGYDDLFRYKKVLNEYDFTPLELVHFLLIRLKLGHHNKGAFRLTQRGKEFGRSPSQLFIEMIPYYLLQIDHSSYSRLDDAPIGNWDVWLNVMNVEIDQGATEKQVYGAFYGEGPDWDNSGWREMAAFSSCVLRPLEWAGLIVEQEDTLDGRVDRHCFKTPLWRAALRLDTDDQLEPVLRH